MFFMRKKKEMRKACRILNNREILEAEFDNQRKFGRKRKGNIKSVCDAQRSFTGQAAHGGAL